jgi:hypothetical protein
VSDEAKEVIQIAGAVDRPTSRIYTADGLAAELRQSEIISNIVQYFRNPAASLDTPEDEVETLAIRHPYAVILSQDCDLLWDFDAKSKGGPPELNGVLLYEAAPADGIRAERDIKLDLWKPIRQNKNDRYQFLEAVPPECDLSKEGIPQLLIDFKRYFTISAQEIVRQISLRDNPARRRCCLQMPYREHLQFRAAQYLQRIVLPAEHKYEQRN